MRRTGRPRGGGAKNEESDSRRILASVAGIDQLQAWRGGLTPFSAKLPMWKYFQRTGSCSVCVRALRQWRSRLYLPTVERAPANSCSLFDARIAISVVETLASA